MVFKTNLDVYKNYYDIVVLPSSRVKNYAIKLSKEIYQYGATWQLREKRFLPHLSLYHLKLKAGSFKDFIQELKLISKNSRLGSLKLTGLAWQPEFRAVLLMTNKPDWLENLYLKIIRGTVKYFDWDFGVAKLWQTVPAGAKKYLTKYGTPMVGQYFRPHITLNVFNELKKFRKLKDDFKRFRIKRLSFKVNCLYVCQLGISHTCQKVITKINF